MIKSLPPLVRLTSANGYPIWLAPTRVISVRGPHGSEEGRAAVSVDDRDPNLEPWFVTEEPDVVADRINNALELERYIV